VLPSPAALGPSVNEVTPLFTADAVSSTWWQLFDDAELSSLIAWRELDDAMTAYAKTQEQKALDTEAVRQNQLALIAVRDRFRAGAADFLDVLTVCNRVCFKVTPRWRTPNKRVRRA
jgi:outer membrane protein TolC